MLSYSYTRAVFKEYKDSITVNGEKSLVDYKDKFVPYVPQNKFGIMVDYMIPFKSSVLKSLFFGTNLSMQGKVYWDEANSYSQNFYAILGVHADADFGMIRLSLWGKNITDTHYSTFAVGSAATGTQCYFAQRGNPIQIGFDVKLHF
jgi:outer membrane receptor protein involved in Fe transport